MCVLPKDRKDRKLTHQPQKKIKPMKRQVTETKRKKTSTSHKSSGSSGSSSNKSATHVSSDASSKGKSGSCKDETEKEETRQERIVKALKSKLKLAFSHFLSQSISTFDRKSVLLQTRNPLIHKLRRELEGLLLDLYSKFVNVQAIKSVTDLTALDYKNSQNHKDDSELVIGNETRQVFMELEPVERKQFYSVVKQYYIKACDYIVAKFPLKSDILLHAEVADINLRMDAKFSSVRFFINKFPCMLLVTEESESLNAATDVLESQFLAYQLADIPTSVLQEDSADKQWAIMSKQKGPCGQLAYDKLSRVMLGILTIPHSNAECERVFSQVRKNKTDFRGSLSNELLSSMLVTKAHQKGPCYNTNFNESFLKKAKSAAYKALNADETRDL